MGIENVDDPLCDEFETISVALGKIQQGMASCARLRAQAKKNQEELFRARRETDNLRSQLRLVRDDNDLLREEIINLKKDNESLQNQKARIEKRHWRMESAVKRLQEDMSYSQSQSNEQGAGEIGTSRTIPRRVRESLKLLFDSPDSYVSSKSPCLSEIANLTDTDCNTPALAQVGGRSSCQGDVQSGKEPYQRGEPASRDSVSLVGSLPPFAVATLAIDSATSVEDSSENEFQLSAIPSNAQLIPKLDISELYDLFGEACNQALGSGGPQKDASPESPERLTPHEEPIHTEDVDEAPRDETVVQQNRPISQSAPDRAEVGQGSSTASQTESNQISRIPVRDDVDATRLSTIISPIDDVAFRRRSVASITTPPRTPRQSTSPASGDIKWEPLYADHQGKILFRDPTKSAARARISQHLSRSQEVQELRGCKECVQWFSAVGGALDTLTTGDMVCTHTGKSAHLSTSKHKKRSAPVTPVRGKRAKRKKSYLASPEGYWNFPL